MIVCLVTARTESGRFLFLILSLVKSNDIIKQNYASIEISVAFWSNAFCKISEIFFFLAKFQGGGFLKATVKDSIVYVRTILSVLV